MIEKVHDLVKDKLGKEPTGHDYLHALRVSKNALEISCNFDVNIELIEVSCLIHDLIDHKLPDKYTLSKNDLRTELSQIGYSSEFLNQVFEIITNISYSKGNTPKSLEGRLVQDADRLDALGAIGIARTFSYGGQNNRLIYGDVDRKDSISHFYDKLLKLPNLMNTSVARKIAVERVEYMRHFLDVFKSETK